MFTPEFGRDSRVSFGSIKKVPGVRNWVRVRKVETSSMDVQEDIERKFIVVGCDAEVGERDGGAAQGVVSWRRSYAGDVGVGK